MERNYFIRKDTLEFVICLWLVFLNISSQSFTCNNSAILVTIMLMEIFRTVQDEDWWTYHDSLYKFSKEWVLNSILDSLIRNQSISIQPISTNVLYAIVYSLIYFSHTYCIQVVLNLYLSLLTTTHIYDYDCVIG